ncbi:MAG: HD domain-containing phosphohydrolase [Planctomycetota bacterium]
MSSEDTILVVDDDSGHRELLAEMVRNLGYTADTASDGFEAMAKIKTGYDLMLLDAQMPGMDGFEVVHKVRNGEHYSEIPIVMVTGLDSSQDEKRAREAGGDAFLSKPVQMDSLESVLKKHLQSKSRTETAGGEENREQEVESYVRDLTEAQRNAYSAQLETLERLAIAAEYRDKMTGAHVRRIGEYCAIIAGHMHLRPHQVEILRYASPLHDVGKIGIPDSILLKDGQLTDEEWETMKQHTEMGARILAGSSSEFLETGRTIALTHQEKWDGSGYPRGLEGDSIPLSGRICAVADVFDALTNDRPYREALSVEQALDIMKSDRGKHFDPEIFDLFLDHLDEVLQIQEEYEDETDAHTASC